MTLKTKLLIFFLVLISLLGLQWFLFIGHERRLLSDEAVSRAGILVRTLAELAREPMASSRYTRLEDQLASIVRERDVLYARVVNDRFRVIADSRKEEEGWSYSGEIARAFETSFEGDRLVARAPIDLLGKQIGMAEIAFSMAPVREKINRNRIIFVEILVFQVLAGAAFWFLMNLQIIAPLRYLSRLLSEAPPETEAHVIGVPRFSSVEIRAMIASVNAMRERLVAFRKDSVEKARFATMGKIAANMAHEIRNPLEAISGAVELMDGDAVPAAESAEYLGIIREEIRNLDEFLGEFLEFAKPQPHEPAPTDLNELLRETLLLLNPLAKKRRVAIGLLLSPDAPVCLADGNALKRAFLNVVLNGIEACSAGGTVEVESRLEAGRCLVAVRDDGPGVSEDVLSRVFEPYYTTKDGGSGLGLSLSKSIVERHGGSIALSRRPEGGTEALILIPEAASHG
jgi:signal transduction histidine kinase